MFDITRVVDSYLETALWAGCDENSEPFDKRFSVDDFSEEAYYDAEEDCGDFCEANEALLLASGMEEESIGHNFLLTRDGHGAGFWDRGLGEVGQKLTEACRPYGGTYIYEAGGELFFG
jgi:hypothetical protein